LKFRSDKIKAVTELHDADQKQLVIGQKLDDLIALISQNELDSETLKQLQQKFNKAIEKKQDRANIINAFKQIDKKDNVSREELLEDFSTLLLSNKIDSKISSNYLKAQRTNKIVLMLVGIIMITLGFAMIIMPAPPYFEMFTIFYFSQDDGVTLMDLISLAIVFSGIYILVRSIYKKPLRQSKYDQ